jgi:hypothetical protein
MTGFISFVCNGVPPLHKGVTGIGAAASKAHAGGAANIAISWAIRFGSDVERVIASSRALVKISAEINRHAGFDLPEICLLVLCGRGRLHRSWHTIAGEGIL